MSNILQIAYTFEGPTDIRFLGNIIERTFEQLAFECKSDIQVYEPQAIDIIGADFVQKIVEMVLEHNYFHIICVHCDSDAPTIENVLKNKFTPAFEAISKLDKSACKNLVAIIPVQMTESWMLADSDLLKLEIGTELTNHQLNIPNHITNIENIADPKQRINEILRISQETLPRRRRKVTISELYTPISKKVSLELLQFLPSYRSFLNDARNALVQLNYLSE